MVLLNVYVCLLSLVELTCTGDEAPSYQALFCNLFSILSTQTLIPFRSCGRGETWSTQME